MTYQQRVRVGARMVISLLLVWLVAFAMAVTLAGCGSSAQSAKTSTGGSTEPRSQKDPARSVRIASRLAPKEREGLIAIPWQVRRSRGGDTIEISSNRGYCVDRESPPELEAAEVSYRGNAAYIRAFVPARQGAPRGTICSDIGYVQYGLIRLRRSLEGLRLFDGSADPPAIRWTRGKSAYSEQGGAGP